MAIRRLRLGLLRDIRNPNCKACPLHRSSVNVCVMGRGNVLAPIHLIGEAPGEAEAETGKPFMGAAGQLMNRVLHELDMQHLVYISNVARCRPPENRKPREDEANTCIKLYLYPELEVIQPRVLVLMGRTPIDRIWRQPFTRGEILYPVIKTPRDLKLLADRVVICTWHPSYCNRVRYWKIGPKVLSEFKHDLGLAKEFVNG